MPNHHCNVLLIDEDEIDTMVTAQMLSDADSRYRVVSCECLNHAVEALQSDLHVDLIMMDLTLPDGTGQRAIDAIAKHAGDLPMIVLSQWDTPFLRKLHATRVASFLQKNSLSLGVLRESIESAVAGNAPSRTDTARRLGEAVSCDHPLHMHLKSQENGNQKEVEIPSHGSMPSREVGELETVQ